MMSSVSAFVKDNWRLLFRRTLTSGAFAIFEASTFFLLMYLPRLSYSTLQLPVDDMIPFVGEFVYPYFLWYGYLVFLPVLAAFKDVTVYRRMCFTWLALTLVSSAVFLLFPTRIARASYSASGLIAQTLLSVVYGNDPGTCLFPSMHVAVAWMGVEALFAMRRTLDGKWFWILTAGELLVIASTVFIKQHYFIDVPAGLLLAMAVWALSGHIDWSGRWTFLN